MPWWPLCACSPTAATNPCWSSAASRSLSGDFRAGVEAGEDARVASLHLVAVLWMGNAEERVTLYCTQYPLTEEARICTVQRRSLGEHDVFVRCLAGTAVAFLAVAVCIVIVGLHIAGAEDGHPD